MSRPFAYSIAAGALGWVVFAVSLWYHHHRPGPEYLEPAVQDQLEEHGMDEASVSRSAPPAIVAETPKIEGTERVAHFSGSAMPTGERPKTQTSANCPTADVRPAGGQTAQLEPAANWTLAPENLGIETWSLDVRKAGRRPFYAFEGTVIAQTPDGDVRRIVKPGEGDEKGWVSSEALGIPPRFGPYVRGTTLPTIEGGFYWSSQRRVWDTGVGYDLDRDKWFVAGGVRF